MMKIETMQAALQNDAELVAESLAGNKDAFQLIVERHQTLICSLAYCATGSVSQSEDLAQETFVTAWKDLGQLREPAKLRSWLCAILRFRIGKQHRQQGRDPIHSAEPLETVDSTAAPEAQPSAQAITKEETAILWRSLEQVPEMYREPLVLFYREHQSIETVAANLELTEDAVKQRLARGRKMLQEEVQAFVEGALARTNPGQLFTLGVLAALPAMTFSAKAATMSAMAKGGAAAKGAGLLGVGMAFFAPAFTFLGMWFDYRLRREAGHPERELKFLRRNYLWICVSVLVFVLTCTLLMDHGASVIKTSPALFAVLIIGLILGYLLMVSVFVWRDIRNIQKMVAAQAPGNATKPPSPFWEYRSRFELFGLPFIHIRFLGWFGRRMEHRLNALKPIKAWIAITDASAVGVLFAYGGFAVAPVSVGAIALGICSFSCIAFGILAVGGFAFGVWGLGIFSAGWQAFGDCAIAWNAALGGQYGIAHLYAIGKAAHAAQVNNDLVWHRMWANPFFQFCLANMTMQRMILISWLWMAPSMLCQIIRAWHITRQRQMKPADS